jgi:hypothetical protein
MGDSAKEGAIMCDVTNEEMAFFFQNDYLETLRTGGGRESFLHAMATRSKNLIGEFCFAFLVLGVEKKKPAEHMSGFIQRVY